MSKKTTLFVFAGFVATAFGRFGAAELDSQSLLAANGLDNNANLASVGFLSGSQLNTAGSDNLSALSQVRGEADNQATRVDQEVSNIGEDNRCDTFATNEWDCGCREGIVQVPQSRYSRTVIEAITDQTIPLQSVSTNTTETTDRCYENNQLAERNVNKRQAFTSNGTVEAHTFDVQQSCLTDVETFDSEGCGEWNFNQHSEDIGADCECKQIPAGHRGRVDTHCDCDCPEPRKDKLSNPDDDIENTVTKQVEKAISDILSDVVERCISTTLKSCITLERDWILSLWLLIHLLTNVLIHLLPLS